MRKRGKQRVIWFPPTPDGVVDDGTNNTNIIGGEDGLTLVVSPVERFDAVETPIIIDQPVPLDDAQSLADIESSGYRLRRIVGKIWVEVQQTDDSNVPDVVVTAGFIVRTVDTNGASMASGSTPDINPALAQNIMDPWIWRRSWFLSNNAAPNRIAKRPPGPENNQFFAALDGPHVDAKTARIIGQEQRLFLDVSACSLTPSDPEDEIPTLVSVWTEVRCLGSMRTMQGNRRNASR